MTTETHISFAVDCREYLHADGGLDHDTPDFLKEPALLLGFYRAMVLTRTFDNKAIALQGPAGSKETSDKAGRKAIDRRRSAEPCPGSFAAARSAVVGASRSPPRAAPWI